MVGERWCCGVSMPARGVAIPSQGIPTTLRRGVYAETSKPSNDFPPSRSPRSWEQPKMYGPTVCPPSLRCESRLADRSGRDFEGLLATGTNERRRAGSSGLSGTCGRVCGIKAFPALTCLQAFAPRGHRLNVLFCGSWRNGQARGSTHYLISCKQLPGKTSDPTGFLANSSELMLVPGEAI